MIEIIYPPSAGVLASISLLDLDETHSSRATPTDSPVEVGADFTDHIKVELRPFSAKCFVGNSMLQAEASDMDGAVDTTVSVPASDGRTFSVQGLSKRVDRVRLVYDRLDGLLNAATLVTIVTPLRRYESMALTGLTFPVKNTDGIEFDLEAREIKIGRTRSLQAPAPRHVRARRTESAGRTQTTPAPTSGANPPPPRPPTRSFLAGLLGGS